MPATETRFRKNPKPIVKSWRLDGTTLKLKNRWSYRYRAVDKTGRTVAVDLSERRDR